MNKLFFIGMLFLTFTSTCIAEDAESEKASRAFTFSYGATLEGLPPGSRVQIWIPVATSNSRQAIRLFATVAQAARDPGRSSSGPKLLASSATGILASAARHATLVIPITAPFCPVSSSILKRLLQTANRNGRLLLGRAVSPPLLSPP